MKHNPLILKPVRAKIKAAQALLESDETNWTSFRVPDKPGRDVQDLKPSKHPDKKGLSHPLGQMRLLHDLASIELQAMELGLRSLIEFCESSEVPPAFLKELSHVTYEESVHCGLCIDLLEDIGGEWGMFPVHLGLWRVSQKQDRVLERLLKVHRYLEGSGLDASHTLLKRLESVQGAEDLKKLIFKIFEDEVNHVRFGSKWFTIFCKAKGLSQVGECKRILKESSNVLPPRRESIQEDLRLKAGFLKDELELFKLHQKGFA